MCTFGAPVDVALDVYYRIGEQVRTIKPQEILQNLWPQSDVEASPVHEMIDALHYSWRTAVESGNKTGAQSALDRLILEAQGRSDDKVISVLRTMSEEASKYAKAAPADQADFAALLYRMANTLNDSLYAAYKLKVKASAM